MVRHTVGSIALGFLLLAWSPASVVAQTGVGSVAPRVTIADLEGTMVAVPASGRITVLEFWATWCEVCEQLLPTVVAAKTSYGDRVDFYGINVTVNESKSRVQRWVVQHAPPFRTLYDDKGIAVRAYNAAVTSYVVIIDANGIIRYTGSGGKQPLSAELGKLLAR